MVRARAHETRLKNGSNLSGYINGPVRLDRRMPFASDAGWGRFIGMIAYKEEESGGRLIKVNPRGTTQTCFRCGERVGKTLSDRMHECPYCGLVLNRDENAALNILARGREIRRGPPESRPAEDRTTTPPLEVVQVYPVKQEASLLVGR